MTDLDELKAQKLFPSRKLGDALIVEPKGALGGYGRNVIDRDVKGIVQAVRDLDVHVVVLNLGSWNYFGSEMIGMFFHLRRLIPDDVRVVICDASRDMRTILETMQVQQVIPIYSTQRAALGDVAHIAFRDHLPSRKYLIPVVIVVALLAVLVVGGLVAGKTIREWAYLLQVTPEIEAYQRLVDFNNDLLQMRSSNASDQEWVAFSQRVRSRITLSLDRAQNADTLSESDRRLINASQIFLEILDEDPQSTERDVELYNALWEVKRILESESGLAVKGPPIPQAD